MNSDPHNPIEYQSRGGLRPEPVREPREQSRGSAADAARSPHDALLQILWRQKWLILLCTVLGAAVAGAYAMLATPQYLGFARLYVQASAPSVSGEGPGALTPEALKTNVYTQRELILSTANLAKTLSAEGVIDLPTFANLKDEDAAFDYLEQNLTVDVGDKDELISIGFATPYRDDAPKVVNAVIESYVKSQTKQRNTKLTEVLKVMREDKEDTDRKLREKTAAMLQFQRDKQVLFESEKGDIANERVKSLSSALTEAQRDTLNAKSAYEDAIKPLADDPAKMQLLIEAQEGGGPTVLYADEEAELRKELFLWQTRLRDYQETYLPNHHFVRSTQRRVDQLTIAYAAAVQRRWSAAKMREYDLQQAYDQEKREAIERSADTEEYARMRDEVKRLEDKAHNLENRIGGIAVDETAGNVLNIQVVEPPRRPDSIYRPKKARTLAIGLVLGLMAGIVLGCLRDWSDPRLRSAEEVTAVLGMPILGAVPNMPGDLTAAVRGQRILLDSSSDAAEAYRALRTALYFGVPDGRAKTILVTSPSPADGKSTLASNLAIAMSQVGKRVLLVDADLRHPRQHETFGAENATGLSGVLGQAEIPVENAIQRTQVAGLDILPCGPRPENPSELLNSQRFLDVMEQLADAYDHVIVDSPPVMAVTDARVIAAGCDVTILVIRQDKANRRMAQMARDGLISVGANILGIVLNRAPRHTQYYGGYGDGYAYRAYRAANATAGGTNGHAAVVAATATVAHANGDDDDEAGMNGADGAEVEDDVVEQAAVDSAAAAAAASSPSPAVTSAEKAKELALRAKELRSGRRLS